MPSEKWISRMLCLADRLRSWSPCAEGKQHACILAVDGKYIVSTGFNGPNKKINTPNCKVKTNTEMCIDLCAPPHSNCNAVHAEVNAVINAAAVGATLSRCVAYCTKQPCDMCRSVLVNAGVLSVHWLEENKRMPFFKDHKENLNG